MTPDVFSLIGRIETEIRRAYLARGWVRFEPRQFADAGFGRSDAVTTAMLGLARMGRLVATATVECDEGHPVWTGDWERAQKHVRDECRVCAASGTEPDEEDQLITLAFALAPQWQGEIDAEHDQKKTPTTPL